ncbi:class I SAM-dependent DNA methyltransferase [Sulfitobacter sabulilitoris]|uniref:Methyltransferase domain-containing protein n=1 Tax=Sulfitobacter sabulilitoris TaxID=2562655 RepID=A0A5S3PLN9_9RHOB|nr:methyltransferase domain-containing protein [Sulfitobacter sabulilitoris]TMM54490.1 methyltransferase domain-containing protein [Sulfitobacter sabulilitoris]
MGDGFLNKAYRTRDPEAIRTLYDEWADTYEAEIAANGYVTPDRCAKALAKYAKDQAAPVLDFGCGTGLSGLALALAGFKVIDGVDLSPEMIDQAREKNVYRDLATIAPGGKLRHQPGRYGAITAIGVIGAGAAPATVFDMLMQGLGRGGLLVCSLNDHAIADRVNEARINEWTDCGAARLLFREHGDHLPGIDLGACVYVIEKA